jgi:putative flippase GtrA
MIMSRKTMVQIFFFLIVGGTTFLIDLGVTAFLYNIVHFPAYLASAVGFLSGFFFNFPMNRKKVFKHTNKDKFTLHQQVFFYIALSIFNLVTTSLLVEGIVHIGVDITIAKFLVTALIAIWNFLIFKFLVFSKQKNN